MRAKKAVFATLPLAVLVAFGACASGGGGGGDSSRSGGANRIIEEEIVEMESQSVFQIIERLRPQWLQVRGMMSTTGPALIQVIVDGVRQPGSLENLNNFRGSEVRELRYLNARDATTRYGTDMAGGAIEVLTRR